MVLARRIALVSSLVFALAGLAEAADHVLGGGKITLRRSGSGKERLTFVAKDPGFLFPAIGSPDDPALGLAGALVEVASAVEPGDTVFRTTAGIGGPPGWKVRDGTLDSYVYLNTAAVYATGPLALQKMTLKQGKVLKVTIRDVPLSLAGPQGMVGIRITMNELRNCALFDAATIRTDRPNVFVAKGSSSSALPDCSNVVPPGPTTTSTSTTLLPTTTSTTSPAPTTSTTTSPGPTTTSTTISYVFCLDSGGSPTCDGTGVCPEDHLCLATADFFATPEPFYCSCFAPGVIPCYQSEYPACGGVCANGGVCQGFRDFSGIYGQCGCVDPAVECDTAGSGPETWTCTPGACPPGKACVSAPLPERGCGCLDE